LDILFAPDWRAGVPYQTLLADALIRRGASVRFVEGYKRFLPLGRLLRTQKCDILHLHWPEAYYPSKGDPFDSLRAFRFPYDLDWAARKAVLVTTAHNFHIHNRADEVLVKRNVRYANRKSKLIFAHSEAAKRKLIQTFGLNPNVLRVIPHGDLSVGLGPPVSQREARAELGLPSGKLALMFGTVEPYKGIEDVIVWWQRSQPAIRLAIVGRPVTAEYAKHITDAIGNTRCIMSNLQYLSDRNLRLWLSTADVVIFNYREIFTSGAASLTRSFGVPLLMPQRLNTVDLGEPSPFVRRFTELALDFRNELEAAIEVRPDFAAAAAWRDACNWDRIADVTLEGYLDSVGEN
jgi:beta-1,4-mannosyltransferase